MGPGRTHPRPTMSRSVSRFPRYAAHKVGVIPSSSGAFSSFRVASISACRWPSRAARWHRSSMAAAPLTGSGPWGLSRALQSGLKHPVRSGLLAGWLLGDGQAACWLAGRGRGRGHDDETRPLFLLNCIVPAWPMEI